jgi:hypothetical protein
MQDATSEGEKILSYIDFIAPSRGNIVRQKWFAVLTNRRLLFYAIKGGGAATFAGTVKGAAIGLGVGFVLALIWPFSARLDTADFVVRAGEFVTRFVALGGLFGIVIGVVMGTRLAVGKSEPQVFPKDVQSLESSLRGSPEQYEFARPDVPKYVERSPFLGGIKIHLAKRRVMSFVHEPVYSQIKHMLHVAQEPAEADLAYDMPGEPPGSAGLSNGSPAEGSA